MILEAVTIVAAATALLSEVAKIVTSKYRLTRKSNVEIRSQNGKTLIVSPSSDPEALKKALKFFLEEKGKK